MLKERKLRYRLTPDILHSEVISPKSKFQLKSRNKSKFKEEVPDFVKPYLYAMPKETYKTVRSKVDQSRPKTRLTDKFAKKAIASPLPVKFNTFSLTEKPVERTPYKLKTFKLSPRAKIHLYMPPKASRQSRIVKHVRRVEDFLSMKDPKLQKDETERSEDEFDGGAFSPSKSYAEKLMKMTVLSTIDWFAN